MVDLIFVFSGRAVFIGALLLFLSCQKKESHPYSPFELKQKKLIKRGKAVYSTICSSCHNINPRLSGSTGPEIHGSSPELLRQKILFQKYPKGYIPKRKTKEMPALKEFEKDIPALHAFLNQSIN